MPINNRQDALHPDLLRVFLAVAPKWAAANPSVKIGLNETSRAEDVQTAYYARGRESVEEVQRLYKLAGLYAIGAGEAAIKNSNARYGQSSHNFPKARAFDIRPTYAATGKYVSNNEDLKRICGKYWAMFKAEADRLKVAVTYGGTWEDWPHIELKYWRTLKA